MYSDGAFTHPATPVFGLASAGVWHPGRTADNGSLSMLEDEFSLCCFKSDGLEISAYLDGIPSSSTRAELVGLIIALYSPGPVHVAIDNAAVVSFAQFLIHHLCTHDYPIVDPTFSHKINGDLWSIFYSALLSKGPAAVRVTKTKGHALQNVEFLRAHPELREQALHNH
eukprot:6932497-Karenia_brevis.AAC.1